MGLVVLSPCAPPVAPLCLLALALPEPLTRSQPLLLALISAPSLALHLASRLSSVPRFTACPGCVSCLPLYHSTLSCSLPATPLTIVCVCVCAYVHTHTYMCVCVCVLYTHQNDVFGGRALLQGMAGWMYGLRRLATQATGSPPEADLAPSDEPADGEVP